MLKRFLMDFCKCGENDNINYKPYEHGSFVQSMHIDKAVEMLKKDIEEMHVFLSAYGITEKEKAIEGTFRIWKRHLVIL